MQQLISELSRLYLHSTLQLPPQAAPQMHQQQAPQQCFEGADREQRVELSAARLEQHLLGLKTLSVDLVAADGSARAIVLDFSAGGASHGEQQWRALCTMANGIKDGLGLAAPAVSISGHGFQLWMSLAAPAPLADLREFAGLLHLAYLADDKGNGALTTVVDLPPARQAGGKWAAFIHPGMGASFADEPALEMAPPVSAQVGFLEGLRSISAVQFHDALADLRSRHAPADQASKAASASAANSANSASSAAPGALAIAGRAADDLLLRDASIEDVVAWLQARRIEVSLRWLPPIE